MTRFNEFWVATGEQTFESLAIMGVDCCRLVIDDSRNAHSVIRMQRNRDPTDSFVVAHSFEHFSDGCCSTNRIPIDDTHWAGLLALMDVCCFWEIPTKYDTRAHVLDGATYTLDAFIDDRRHRVVRKSPNLVVYGGELLCVVTDYLRSLELLATYHNDEELRRRYG